MESSTGQPFVVRRQLQLPWLLLCLLLLGYQTGCAGLLSRHPCQGTLANTPIRTTVDSKLARYYLEHYLAGQRAEPQLDQQIDKILAEIPPGIPNHETLAKLTKEHSTDFATLVLAQRITEAPQNQPLQSLYQQLRDSAPNDTNLPRGPPNTVFLLAPGWLYKTLSHTGADFADFRKMADRLQLRYQMISTKEKGTVEENAQIIAESIRRIGRDQHGTRVVVVSVSKSAGEVHMALGQLLRPEETRHVQAWVNVAGVLRGSSLADHVVRFSPLYAPVFRLSGWGSLRAVRSMRCKAAQQRWSQMQLPDHLLVINYVPIPLSGQMKDRHHFLLPYLYASLKSEGPNDGLTLVADSIHPQGSTIIEFGSTHFFRTADLAHRCLALEQTVETCLNWPAGANSATQLATAPERPSHHSDYDAAQRPWAASRVEQTSAWPTAADRPAARQQPAW